MDADALYRLWSSHPVLEAPVSEIEGEEEPSHLNTVKYYGGCNVVSMGKLSVRYVGCEHGDHEVGAAQANQPAPTRRLLYYFEMTVKNAGQNGHVAVGFTPPGIEMSQQPDWKGSCCGYLGVDGMIYRGLIRGEKFGPKFTTGDTVGAGINYASREFFFTKNGELVGTVGNNTEGPMFPTVSVHGQNEEVNANFGEQPFLFNIKDYFLEEKTKQLIMIENCNLQANLGHQLVRAYLLHYGYEETLNSFDAESGNSIQLADAGQENLVDHFQAYELNRRKILSQLIRNGEIDSAMVKLQEWFPETVQDEKNTICFLLCLQKFIEQMRIRELKAALTYARANFIKFFSIKYREKFLQGCMALFIYERPSQARVGYLFDANQRELVADAVNVAVLSTDPKAEDRVKVFYADLEKLIRRLTTCSTERRALLGDQGEAFHPRPVLHSSGSSPFG